MELALTPELEATIQRELDSGRFHSPLEVVAAALDLLRDEDEILGPQRGSLESRLDESLAAAGRGELYTADQAREHLAQMRKSL